MSVLAISSILQVTRLRWNQENCKAFGAFEGFALWNGDGFRCHWEVELLQVQVATCILSSEQTLIEE